MDGENTSGTARDRPGIPQTEVQVGDLVFLKPVGHEQLPALIVDLDGGPFSHVGMVVEPGVIASSRTSRLSLKPVDDLDTGGVRLNAIVDLRARQPHIARLSVPPADRIVAATRTLQLLEFGAAHQSGFSFIKLFIVAAGLDAVRERQSPDGRKAILSAAAHAAELWVSSEQWRLGQQPTFFCSEGICLPYPPLEFTYAEFEAVPGSPEVEFDALGEEDWFFDRLHRILDQSPPRLTPEQRNSVIALGHALLHHDPKFLGRAGRALFDFLRPHIEYQPPVPSPDARVPASLVTPRMLWASSRFVEWRGPLELPTCGQGHPCV